MTSCHIASPLLRLPRELRDVVYQYALSEDGGLVADIIDDCGQPLQLRAKHTGNNEQESNQLRLTCRQLYAETSGLGIQYNDITFIDTTKRGRTSAYQHFTRFIDIISHAHLNKVKRAIILDGQTPYHDESLDLMRKCCHTYPVLKICHNLPYLVVVVRLHCTKSLDGEEYMHGMDYLRDARKRSIYLHATIDDVDADDVDEIVGHEGPYTFAHPPNLRFSFTFEFQEDLVRSTLGDEYAGKRLEDLVDLVRREHKDGI
jgi:hypothetical protein